MFDYLLVESRNTLVGFFTEQNLDLGFNSKVIQVCKRDALGPPLDLPLDLLHCNLFSYGLCRLVFILFTSMCIMYFNK